MVVISLSIMIFTTTSSVLSGLYAAPAAFAADEGFVISSSAAPTIFASQVEASMVSVLEALPNITGVSPEVFAFSGWNGHSFVIRGVDLDRLNSTGPAFREFRLSDRLGSMDDTAIIGSSLLKRLGIELPYTLSLVGSYSSRVQFVKVVGWFETGSSLDDELLLSLDSARFLSGMNSQRVSIIRIGTSEPEWLSALLSPEGPRFTLFDLLVRKSQVAIGEEVSVSVGVKNWGADPGTAEVSFSVDGQVYETRAVALNASESTRVLSVTVLSELGNHTVAASVGGEFQISLSANVTAVQPYLRIACPSKAPLNANFTVSVTDHLGRAVADAIVSFGAHTYVTNDWGNTTLLADAAGTFQVTAEHEGFTTARATVTVVDQSTYPTVFAPTLVSFTLSPDIIKEPESATGMAMVQNDGSLPGELNLTVLLDGAPYTTINVSLDGLESRSVAFRLRSIGVGTHVVQVGNFSHELTVRSWIVDNPDLVQLVMRYSGSSELFSAGAVPIYQAAKISEGNVAVATASVGAISALLAFLAITSVFSKEVHEGRGRLGILKTIGASGSAIRRLVFPQALEAGLGGAALGVALGVVAADLLSKSDVFVIFGHGFRLELDTALLVLVLLGAVAISVMSALASAMMAVRETAIRSIRKLGEDSAEPLDVQRVIGD